MPATGGVDLSVVLAYTIGLIMAYFVFRLLWMPAKALLRVATAAAIGAVSLGLINLVGAYVGFSVPFNALSILSAGFLGIPGIVLVIALSTLL